MNFIPDIPNNSIKEKLDEIVHIAKAAMNSYVYEAKLLTFEFNPPATNDDIIKLEKALNAELDEEYKDFLRFSNGAVLCYNSAVFYNIDTVLSVAAQAKEKVFPEDYIILGEIIGDGEMLCYSKKSREYISLFEGREKHFNTFSDCLNKIIRRIRNKVGEHADL
jgi:hypothetical protein